MQHAKDKLEHSRQLFNEEKNNALTNGKLTHQLYMNEQRYNQALFKERNSRGFLSTLAASIENQRNR